MFNIQKSAQADNHACHRLNIYSEKIWFKVSKPFYANNISIIFFVLKCTHFGIKKPIRPF